eukprot:TRINITY_DN14303_c0_g3_i8.p1 TRINITY_DN14303_c0_g3~~TRINITY_DN14303_c0_g3_i8.p1  ORF type:complete len:368 (+),score=84.80 TRINITY_DN14303_c0_g3_i8:55-1158(+)
MAHLVQAVVSTQSTGMTDREFKKPVIHDDWEPKNSSTEFQNDVATMKNMFGELTDSVICTVLLQNKGDLPEAVDTLINISQDVDALEAVRNLSVQQRAQLEEEMKEEQERRTKERQKQLKQEIQKERATVEDIKRQIESEQRILAERGKVNDLLEAEHMKCTIETDEIQDELRLQVEEKTRIIEQKRDEIKNKENLVSIIQRQSELCTLSVRYSTRTMVVSWSLGRDLIALPTSWIGLFRVGKPDNQYKAYYSTDATRQGHHTFSTPKTPGLYEFRYFDKDYNHVARSDVIHVGPNLDIMASVTPISDSREEIVVEFTLKSGQLGSQDWFGLYPANQPGNRNYLSCHVVGKNIRMTFLHSFINDNPP